MLIAIIAIIVMLGFADNARREYNEIKRLYAVRKEAEAQLEAWRILSKS